MLSVLTETPGMTAPMQANILPPTFQASCPPPQGSDTSAPGNLRQMVFTSFRLICSLPLARSTSWFTYKLAVGKLEQQRRVAGVSLTVLGQWTPARQVLATQGRQGLEQG